MLSLAQATDLARADLAAEAAAGFPAFSRIPATGLIAFLDYFAGLDEPGRAALLDVFAQFSAMRFFPQPEIAPLFQEIQTNNPARVAYLEAMRSPRFAYGLRYRNLKMARSMLNDPESLANMTNLRSTLDWQPRDDPPPSLSPEPDIRKIVPAGAPLLRKLVDPAFSKLLAAKKSKQPGGLTEYAGHLSGVEVAVSFDFASRLGQIRYTVRTPPVHPATKVCLLNYEDYLGAHGWDYLTEENAGRSIELLCRNVESLVNLRNRVAAQPNEP